MNNNETAATVFFIIGAALVLWKLLDTFVKVRGTRKNDGTSDSLQALEQRFARVEVAIDDLTSEVHRVTESNGFLTRLLSDRSRDAESIDRR
jgi:phosphatidate phosphatase APP1